MRILFLSNFYPPHDIGGYEQWCMEIVGKLRARGHDTFALTSRHGLSVGSPTEEEGVSRSLYLEADLNHYDPVDYFLKQRSHERANLRRLKASIDDWLPEIVFVWNMWNLSPWLPYCAEQWLPGRVAYYISNYWPIDPNPHIKYWSLPPVERMGRLVKPALRRLALSRQRRRPWPNLRFAHAACCSEYVRKTLVDSGRLPASTRVLLGGVDTTPFVAHSRLSQSHLSDPLELLYFGRLIPDKGVHTAIEALGRLQAQSNTLNLRLTILGSGHPRYEEALRQLVQQRGLDDLVTHVPKIPRMEIPEWLGRFDINLFTSTWPEPMARSVMEAMAAGLMVIATDVGGQAEMLSDGKNSLTFPPGDAEALAERLAAVTGGSMDHRALARAGQEMVCRQFTLDRMADEIEDFLQEILVTR